MAYWKDENRPLEKIDKRGGPDLLVKWVRISSLLSWLMFFTTLLIWDSSRPQIYTFLDMQYNKVSRAGWDVQRIQWAFIATIITFLFTVVSLLFNSQRLKRKYDKISISLVICMIGSGVAMLAFFFYYLGVV